MSGPESELQKRLKGIQWQSQNCLSCIWFATTDPLNADLFDRAMCIHPKLKIYQLVVSGRDWGNLYEEIKQKQIKHKQDMVLKAEEKSGLNVIVLGLSWLWDFVLAISLVITRIILMLLTR